MSSAPSSTRVVNTHSAAGRRTVASHAIVAGAVVSRVPAFAWTRTEAPGDRERVCLRCLADGSAPLQCDACAGLAAYCSVACQSADAPLHAVECALLARAPRELLCPDTPAELAEVR